MCRKCERRPAQQVHHLHYERTGHEEEADLISVCFNFIRRAVEHLDYGNDWKNTWHHNLHMSHFYLVKLFPSGCLLKSLSSPAQNENVCTNRSRECQALGN